MIYTKKQFRSFNKTTNLPKGTFKKGDKHPWLRGCFFSQYAKGVERWVQTDPLARQREWRADNNEEVSKYARSYRVKNRSKINARNRERYNNDPAAFKRYWNDWASKNPSSVAKWRAGQKDKRMATKVELSPSDREMMRHIWDTAARVNRCLGSTVFHIDHTKPLSKGGTHSPDNVQMVPAKWNISKGNNHERAWTVPFAK